VPCATASRIHSYNLRAVPAVDDWRSSGRHKQPMRQRKAERIGA
jgi:hypothetical protein